MDKTYEFEYESNDEYAQDTSSDEDDYPPRKRQKMNEYDVLNKILFGNQKRKNSNGRGPSSTPRRKSNKNRTTFSSTPSRKNSKGKGTHCTPGSGRHGSSHSHTSALIRTSGGTPRQDPGPLQHSGAHQGTSHDAPRQRSGAHQDTSPDTPHQLSGAHQGTSPDAPRQRSGAHQGTSPDTPRQRSGAHQVTSHDAPRQRSGAHQDTSPDTPHQRSGAHQGTIPDAPRQRSVAHQDTSPDTPHQLSGSSHRAHGTLSNGDAVDPSVYSSSDEEEEPDVRLQDFVKLVVRELQRTNSKENSKPKHAVSLLVRSETRKMYQTLMEDTDGFNGFDIGLGVTFNDPNNQAMVSTLIREVQARNKSFQACDIRAAAYTYYKTLSQGASLRRRGLDEQRNKIRRRRERLTRKLAARKATLSKSSLSSKEKSKWSKILVNELMSSDESDSGGTLKVKDIPWHSLTVTEFFKSLDDQAESTKSEQARRQTKTRVLGGTNSSRPRPSKVPGWALLAEQ